MKNKSKSIPVLLGLLLIVTIAVLGLSSDTLISLAKLFSLSPLAPPPSPTASRGFQSSPLGTPIPLPIESLVTTTPILEVIPTIPPPPGWPTDAPWPLPTEQPKPTLTRPPRLLPLGFPPNNIESLYYVADNSSFPELHVVGMDAQGGKQAEFSVPFDLPSENLVGLYPSPNGEYLAIEIFYGPQDTLLYIVERSSDQTWCPFSATEHCFGSFWDWTHDNRLLFSATPGNTLEGVIPFSGVLVDVNTGRYVQLDLPTSADQVYSVARNVSFSPDESRVVFTLTHFDEYKKEISEIWIMRLDSGERQFVRKMEGVINALSWAPVGEQLVYFYRPGTLTATSDPSELWLVNSDGTGSRRLADQTCNPDKGTYGPVWSPDGRYVAFVQVDDLALYLSDWREPGTNIYIADVATGEITRLSAFAGRNNCIPIWSPDGKFLAFVSGIITGTPESNLGIASAEVWIASVDGSWFYSVAERAKYSYVLAWLPPLSTNDVR